MEMQSSVGFFKKGVMRNFAEFTRKHMCQNLFFDKVKIRRSATSLKACFQRKCFLVKSARFVGTSFLQNTTRRLLLIVAVSIVVKGELLPNETVKYDPKIKAYVQQLEPEMFLKRAIQVIEEVSEAVVCRTEISCT